MSQSILSSSQLSAIGRGSHDNPFSVLGMHILTDKTGLVVRTFKPYATSVVLVNEKNGKQLELTQVSDEGVFETVIKKVKTHFPYHFIITWPGADPIQQKDPYSFGPQLSDFDLHLWGEGNHHYAYRFMGAHVKEIDGVSGTHFVVCAPSAKRVSVIGTFNGWDGRVHVMRKYYDQGIWEIFIPGIKDGDAYKFEISSQNTSLPLKKA